MKRRAYQVCSLLPETGDSKNSNNGLLSLSFRFELQHPAPPPMRELQCRAVAFVLTKNRSVRLLMKQRDAWLKIMAHSISLNASYFNTQRMVQQYVLKVYYD